jgi:hypothetical protein
VNFLGSLDKLEADVFTSLCGFVISVGDIVPVVYDAQAAIYNDRGIHFTSLTHLDDIGLVSFDNLAGFRRVKLPKKLKAYYYGTIFHLELKKEDGNDLDLGNVLLTNTGEQLARICGAKPVDGFLDYLIKYWASKGLVLSSPFPRIIDTEQRLSPDETTHG